MTTATATAKALPKTQQALLDQLANAEVLVTYSEWDEQWFALPVDAEGHRVGQRKACTAPAKALVAKGLLSMGNFQLTAAGFAQVSTGNGDELAEAQRMRNLPATVMAAAPLERPEAFVQAETLPTAEPRDGTAEHDLTATLHRTAAHEHDQYASNATLKVLDMPGYVTRHGLYFYGPDAIGRREYGGPLVRGAAAVTFGASATMTGDKDKGTAGEIAASKAAGLWFEVHLGDVIVLQGYRFVIGLADRHNIKLTRASH